jgi:hypothetical protein
MLLKSLVINFNKGVSTQMLIRSVSGTILQNYRPKWPLTNFTASEPVPHIPEKTISEDKLRFELSATMNKGTNIFYPHLQSHPADLKVRLFVSFYQYLITITNNTIYTYNL